MYLDLVQIYMHVHVSYWCSDIKFSKAKFKILGIEFYLHDRSEHLDLFVPPANMIETYGLYFLSMSAAALLLIQF